jgi:hypothetical protein
LEGPPTIYSYYHPTNIFVDGGGITPTNKNPTNKNKDKKLTLQIRWELPYK